MFKELIKTQSKSNNFHPGFLTDIKDKLTRLIMKIQISQSINQETGEEDWENLAELLKTIGEYQNREYLNPESIVIMKDSFEELTALLSLSSISTKSQFLVFMRWSSIYNLSNSINFRGGLQQAIVYLNRLHEILISPNKSIQNILHAYSNVLFRYEFLEYCSYNDYLESRERLIDVLNEIFNLFELFNKKSYYFFIRNGLAFCEALLQSAERSKETVIKNDVVNILENEFTSIFQENILEQEQKIIIRKLSYLTIKSIEEQNITSLFKFCEKTVIRDIYPYEEEILIREITVKIFSALPFTNDSITQIPKKLENTYFYFAKEFEVLLNNKKNKCILFVAKDIASYEIYNYALLGKSTGNGGVTECSWFLFEGERELSCIPTATMYIEDNNVWNLEHEFNHILLHLYAGLEVADQMDKYGKYHRLDWLNEGLSYVLVPDNPIAVEYDSVSKKDFPCIRDIIEAPSQNYVTSYALVDFLLRKQKTLLVEMLMDSKNGRKDLLIEKLDSLSSLDADFYSHLEKTIEWL